MTSLYRYRRGQTGASLIEVLIAILLISFGMLSLGGMLAFAVQMPKLAGYRATAANLASSHIERIRANAVGFQSGNYGKPLSYNGTFNEIALVPCAYPNCTSISIADMDSAATQRAVRMELPAGGMLTTCDPTPCTRNSFGNIWIIWQEPSTFASLNNAASDNCPAGVAGVFTNPVPRCLYVRFMP